jgi:hypothetical protein
MNFMKKGIEQKKLSVKDSCRLFKDIAREVGGTPVMDNVTRQSIIDFSQKYTPGDDDWKVRIVGEFDFEEATIGAQSRDKETVYAAWIAIYQAAVGLYPIAHPCQKSKEYIEKYFNFELARSMAESNDKNYDNCKIAGWVIISQQAKINHPNAKKYFVDHYMKLTEKEKSRIKNVLNSQPPTSQSRPRP